MSHPAEVDWTGLAKCSPTRLCKDRQDGCTLWFDVTWRIRGTEERIVAQHDQCSPDSDRKS